VQVKKVNKYICDFCGKKNYSKHAMEVHEKHCTMNPNREWRMCVALNGGTSTALSELKKLITDDLKTGYLFEKQFPIDESDDDYLLFKKIVKVADKIYELSSQCPMCTMAALRQTGIPVYESIFDYKKSLTIALDEIHRERVSHYTGISYRDCS